MPEIHHFACAQDEWRYIAERIRQLIGLGLSPDKIAILYRNSHQAESAEKILALNGIAFVSTRDDNAKRYLFSAEPSVKIVSMFSSKGLEFDTVYIIGADQKEDDNSVTSGPSERRVFFVAMTRAVEALGFERTPCQNFASSFEP